MSKIANFVRESVTELKKVQWPSREEVISSTKVVIISVLVISAILGFFDIVLAAAVSAIF